MNQPNSPLSVLKPTHVAPYEIGHHRVWVKRDDLCCPAPGPGISKMRGILPHVFNRPEPVIGVLDAAHSKNGWGVAYACSLIGKECVNYWPRSKAHPSRGEAQNRAEELGAEVKALQATRSTVLYARARRDLEALYGRNAYLIPNAMKIQDITDAVAEEFTATPWPMSGEPTAIVVPVGTGTLAAGVIRGVKTLFPKARVILHLGYSRPEHVLFRYLSERAGFDVTEMSVQVIDQGYTYHDAVPNNFGFPSSPYYEAKALTWLEALPLGWGAGILKNVVFWNAG